MEARAAAAAAVASAGGIGSGGSSSSEDEDDDDGVIPDKTEAQIFETLMKIRAKVCMCVCVCGRGGAPPRCSAPPLTLVCVLVPRRPTSPVGLVGLAGPAPALVPHAAPLAGCLNL